MTVIALMKTRRLLIINSSWRSLFSLSVQYPTLTCTYQCRPSRTVKSSTFWVSSSLLSCGLGFSFWLDLCLITVFILMLIPESSASPMASQPTSISLWNATFSQTQDKQFLFCSAQLSLFCHTFWEFLKCLISDWLTMSGGRWISTLCLCGASPSLWLPSATVI